MIELVSASRCVTCDLCIAVCPMNVFDRAEDGLPVIARQEDCQTCYLCEAHCPTDALYVAAERTPLSDRLRPREAELAGTDLMGSYRARLGWGRGLRPPGTLNAAVELSHAPAAAAGVAPPRQPAPAAFHEECPDV
ncbi:4Fe-4S dicluster domain-containing protein [Celeribacter indicus]|uniref:NADH-quinone oxidoreductase subunits H/I n=1 Tax=Celeribacter indicus TaxID=1208324 RepID=A0A0B5DUJ1_9RHOB|nr:ferredoxin family protein [Celeribacter indicus]AJE47098.1 NADH-quinone oxidoreductase subunits H/I [Celeribacter indicus]SDW90952.1 NAD-dependent dihydropyrimidine dehydrogenase, PreA subunit [Celeribacter indicus]